MSNQATGSRSDYLPCQCDEEHTSDRIAATVTYGILFSNKVLNSIAACFSAMMFRCDSAFAPRFMLRCVTHRECRHLFEHSFLFQPTDQKMISRQPTSSLLDKEQCECRYRVVALQDKWQTSASDARFACVRETNLRRIENRTPGHSIAIIRLVFLLFVVGSAVHVLR